MARVRRGTSFRMRCTEAELTSLADAAAAAQLTMTEFVRHAVAVARSRVSADRAGTFPRSRRDASSGPDLATPPASNRVQRVVTENKGHPDTVQGSTPCKAVGRARAFLINQADDVILVEAAERYGMTVGAFVRRAIRGAISQQPMLSPVETEMINAAIREFRQASRDLNALLRETYRHASGTAQEAPDAEELRLMADNLQTLAAALRNKLNAMPWGHV